MNKLQYFLLLIIGLVNSVYTFAEGDKNNPTEKKSVAKPVLKKLSKDQELLRLVDIESDAIEKVQKPGEQLKYRLFELYSEKTKLFRRIENEKLLVDQNKGIKVERSTYYVESEKWFQKSLNFGQNLLTEYPKGRYHTQIYYGLASNTIEVRNDVEKDKTKIIQWLMNAINASRSAEKSYVAQVKLAEVYYTIKDYQTAIKYYKEVIGNDKDRWYTKNLYNLSWCYFQTKEYEKSIQLALKSYAKSKNPTFEDLRSQTGDALDYFYVFNKTPELAIQFHGKNTLDAKEREGHFLRTLNLSKKFISSDVALQAESAARLVCSAKKDVSCLFSLTAFKLDIYKEKKSYLAHHATFREALKEYSQLIKPIDNVQQDTLNLIVNNGAELASTFQSMTYKSYYIFNQNADETYVKIIDYYQVLKQLNGLFHYEYAYLQGELSYHEKKYLEASRYYFESHGKLADKKDFAPKLFKSMLALANDSEFKDKNYFEKTHLAYIAYYPREDHSSTIYQALFKFYQINTNVDLSEKLLVTYQKEMPKEQIVQQEMLKILLNNFINLKNTSKLNDWIGQLRSGFLKMDQNFIDENVKVLAQLLFEKAQNKEKEKQYAQAIEEYRKIVETEIYPREIRSDSMFNMSVDYLQILNASKSLEWLEKSLTMKTRPEILKVIDTVQLMAKQYALIQALPESSKTYEHLFTKYCDDLPNRDSLYLFYTQIELAQESDHFLAISKSKCDFKVETLDQARGFYLSTIWEQGRYRKVVDLLQKPDFEKHQLNYFTKFQVAYWGFDQAQVDPKFNLLWEQFQRFVKETKLKSKWTRVEEKTWDYLSFYNEEIKQFEIMDIQRKKAGIVSGKMDDLQKKLETHLENLANLKKSKIEILTTVTDNSSYQATMLFLRDRFGIFLKEFQSWKLTEPSKANDWKGVVTQVENGIKDQINSFNKAIEDTLNKGSLPIAMLSKKRADLNYQKYLSKGSAVDHRYYLYRTFAREETEVNKDKGDHR